MLFENDCLLEMKNISDNSIDMIYLDPPFFSQKIHKLSNQKGFVYQFEDKWDSLNDYIFFMEERLIEMKRILTKHGSIFLHCDSSAVHYLKVLMDKIFGYDNFRSDIIWTYKRWSNSKKGLLNSHQNILYYTKSNDFTFNTIFCKYSPTTNIDQILQDRVRNDNGKSTYKRDSNGDIMFNSEKKGVPMSDVWEIPFLNPKAKERVGYPTQKPVELLKRIIEISTNQNDIVLDPFCGSGTTLLACKLLNRQFIGIDKNPLAISITNKRLNDVIYTQSNVLKFGKSSFETKSLFEKSILESLNCDVVQRNKGIDGFLKEKFNGGLIAIKIQKESENIQDSINLLKKAGDKKKCSLLILILTNFFDNVVYNKPSNMIMLESYNLKINNLIKEGNIYD